MSNYYLPCQSCRLPIMTSWLRLACCIILCLYLAVIVNAGNKPIYARECMVWENISRSMEQEPNVELQCARNAECSGMDCIGKYDYHGSLGQLVNFEQDFCSGIVLEACSSPVKVQMYVVLFVQNHTSTKETELTVTNSTEVPIQGPNFQVLGSEAKIVMDITMNHTTIKGKPHIFLSAFMRIKVKAKIFGAEFEQYLDGFEVGVVRGMYIPVPECNPHIANHTHESGMCTWKSISQLQRTGPKTQCAPNSMESCGNHEMCNPDTKLCDCSPKYIYDAAHNVCTPDIIIDYMPSDEDPDTDGHSSKMSQKHVIIIVCSLAGLLILVAIIATVLVKRKRNSDRYGQHQLVLAEDDDPEVEA